MSRERNRGQNLTLALCVLLLALNLWQGRQLRNLRRYAWSAGDSAADRTDSLAEQTPPREYPGQPETAGEGAAFAWAECARIDPALRTMTLCIRVERPGAGDPYFVNVRHGADGRSDSVSLHRLPDGALGGELTLPLELDGEVELVQSNGGVLFHRESLAALLPIQMSACPDLLIAEGKAYLRECRIELTDPQGGWAEVAEAEYRVNWNGEPVISGVCGPGSRGPMELESWTLPFAEGDTLEYHVLCTDRCGLRYDFTLCKRPAGESEDGPERCWPAILWPGE